MKKFSVVAGICLMLICIVKAVDPTPPAYEIILQDVVYGGDLTLTSNTRLPVNCLFEAKSKDYYQMIDVYSGDKNMSVVLDGYQSDLPIDYDIIKVIPHFLVYGTIEGYSLKAQALSDTTVEVSWIIREINSNYIVEDSIGSTAIAVECSSHDDYCYGYIRNLPAPIDDEYKTKLTPPTEPPLTTTITSTTILPFTEAMEVPQLTLLTFHRTDESTMEVCFKDADPPIITDTSTADQVTFTFNINGMEQHSRTAFELKKINNTIHCASFDVTDLSEFTEAFALVGQLSVHNQDDLQMNMATIFTSFQMPGSTEIPSCSSAAILKNDAEPFVIVECRENDELDGLTIVTASEDDPISFLEADVITAAKVVDNTTYYLGLSANVGSNTPTKLYISKEITVSPSLNRTVHVYSGPVDELHLIDPIENPTTEQTVVYNDSLTLTFGQSLTDNTSFIFEINDETKIQQIPQGATNVTVNLTNYVIDQDITYLIYDPANSTAASSTIKGYSLKGQALSDTKVEVSWINCDQNSDYIVEDSTGNTTITVECGTDDYCYGYFTNLSPQIGDEYRATLTPTAVTPSTTITSMIISPVTKDIEIHVQEVHLDWSNDLRMVETEVCFQHTSTAHYTNEAAFDYEGVIVNNQGEWRRGQGLGMDSEGNSCLKPLILDTESFSVRGEMTVIVLKRAQDGRTVLASGETIMFFYK